MNAPPVRFAQQLADERLLDALARDEPDPPPDELARLLADWRSDLLAHPAPPVAPTATCAAATRVRAHRRRGRTRRVFAAATAAMVFAGGGATVASAASAGDPNSPLWPVTQLIYPARAESQLAVHDVEETLAEARAATDAQRYASAARLLDEAELRADAVQHPDERRRLLAEVARLRALLPDGEPSPGRTGRPAPVAGQSTPTPAEGTPVAPERPAEPGEADEPGAGDPPGSAVPPSLPHPPPVELRPSPPPAPSPPPGAPDPADPSG